MWIAELQDLSLKLFACGIFAFFLICFGCALQDFYYPNCRLRIPPLPRYNRHIVDRLMMITETLATHVETNSRSLILDYLGVHQIFDSSNVWQKLENIHSHGKGLGFRVLYRTDRDCQLHGCKHIVFETSLSARHSYSSCGRSFTAWGNRIDLRLDDFIALLLEWHSWEEVYETMYTSSNRHQFRSHYNLLRTAVKTHLLYWLEKIS
jgi:hypothetical protein